MDTIKNVQNFFEEFGFGRSENDNFAPWWLSNRFKITPQKAMGLSSDGSADFGLDAYFLNKVNEDQFQVYIVQAKYSDDVNYIKAGVKSFKKLIPIIHSALAGGELTSYYENVVIQRFFSDLRNISGKQIHLQFNVISLSNLDPEIINQRTQYSQKEISDEIKDSLKSISKLSWDISCLTRKNLLPEENTSPSTTSELDVIYFNGSDKVVTQNSYFMSGIGKLSDLVKLYEIYSNQLFEKNVRFYLYTKKNDESGPAGKIKETLRDIVLEKNTPPEKFAFLHNGVTIFTRSIEKKDNKIALFSPNVLNGCQTIKSSYLFYHTAKSKNGFDETIWSNIPITLRIVVSSDDSLWKEIAEANNRQNALKPSALHANDKVQIILQNQFKKYNIYYERQEGSFASLEKSQRNLIDQYYFNSPKKPVKIDMLARSMLCASELPLYFASNMTNFYEDNNVYSQVFRDNVDYDIPYLVLLINIYEILNLLIREALPENTIKYSGMNITKYRFLVMRLLLKVFEANQIRDKLKEDYGFNVIGSNNSNTSKDLRDQIRPLLRSRDYPILSSLADVFIKDDLWQDAFDSDLIKKATNSLKLGNIKIQLFK